jgi:hypothetical protein
MRRWCRAWLIPTWSLCIILAGRTAAFACGSHQSAHDLVHSVLCLDASHPVKMSDASFVAEECRGRSSAKDSSVWSLPHSLLPTSHSLFVYLLMSSVGCKTPPCPSYLDPLSEVSVRVARPGPMLPWTSCDSGMRAARSTRMSSRQGNVISPNSPSRQTMKEEWSHDASLVWSDTHVRTDICPQRRDSCAERHDGWQYIGHVRGEADALA